jgi:hypothetical protein
VWQPLLHHILLTTVRERPALVPAEQGTIERVNAIISEYPARGLVLTVRHLRRSKGWVRRKRAALAEASHVHDDNFPEDFSLGVGAGSPALLRPPAFYDLRGVVCRPPSATKNQEAVRRVDRKLEGNV